VKGYLFSQIRAAAKMILLEVNGCDDNTYIEVTMAEAMALDAVVERVNKASTYGCMPTMEIYWPDHEHYKYALESWEYQNEE